MVVGDTDFAGVVDGVACHKNHRAGCYRSNSFELPLASGVAQGTCLSGTSDSDDALLCCYSRLRPSLPE